MNQLKGRALGEALLLPCNLLRSGEELKLLPIKSEDLRQFRRLAKEYGVLFCPIKNKSLDNGLNDILFPASAAASVNRVLEHLGYPVPREKAVEVKKEAARGRSGSASQTRGHGSDSNARTTATERPLPARLQKQARRQTDNAVRTVTRDEQYFEL